MRTRLNSAAWVLLCVLPFSIAGPVPVPASCNLKCNPTVNNKFQYKIGQTYVYNFEASTKTSVHETSDDKAVLDVKGQASVTFRTQCEAVLELTKTSFSGLKQQVDSKDLEKFPLLFSWEDGAIESICSNPTDVAWAVNIKRAVLSMMQHSAQFLEVSENFVYENDVVGRCATAYQVVESKGDLVQVTKTKVPNQCSKRIGRLAFIPTVPYNVPAETQTLPILNSTSVCNQKIKAGVLQSTQCSESHLLRPFSSPLGGGARTEATSSLTFVSKSTAAPISTPSISKTSDLIFDHKHDGQSSRNVDSVVKALCEHLTTESPSQVPHLFNEMVQSMRKATPKEIKAAYANLKSKKNCAQTAKTEHLFYDALPRAGNAATLSLMLDLLKENKVASERAIGWYLLFPLSKHVTLDVVKSTVFLVEPNLDNPTALLGLSGLVHRYCRYHVEECESHPDVLQLSVKFNRAIANKCNVKDAKDEIRVISGLKALGNLGVMKPEVRNNVNECMKDQRLPASIRIAAIDALRNSPCQQQTTGTLLNILENGEEDSEVRISAYLALMRHPCSETLTRVLNLLNSVESDQVGSFISGHLDNLRQNPTPLRQEVRRLLKTQGKYSNRSFPQDLRKYSRNLVSSHFCSVNNAGWEVDANVIYSQKSFIPRLFTANFTLDLFGQSVNFFEGGARFENLENFISKMMGLDGTPSSDGKSSPSVKSNEMEALDKKVIKARENKKDKSTDVKVDAYFRIFGTEVGMVSQHGVSGQLIPDLQKRFDKVLQDFVKGLKKTQLDVAKALTILDSTVTLPTVTGMPIRLSANGVTTITLDLETEMDIPALIQDPKNGVVHIKTSPTVVTEVTTTMVIDIGQAKTGIKIASTLYASSSSDFKLSMKKGDFEMRLDLPTAKPRQLAFTSELLVIQQNADATEQSTKMTIKNAETYLHNQCSEKFTAFTGLRLCGSSSVTVPRPLTDLSVDAVPRYPLSGHGSFSIALEKSEPSMTGYLISTKLKREPEMSSFVVTTDTPGSTTVRKTTVSGSIKTGTTTDVKFTVKGPTVEKSVEIVVVNEDNYKSLAASVADGKTVYGFKYQLDIVKTQGKNEYSTVITAEYPGQPRTTITESKVVHQPGRFLQFSLTPSGPFAKYPLEIQLSVAKEMTSKGMKLSLSKYRLTTPFGKSYTEKAEIIRQRDLLSTALEMKYGNNLEYDVTFNTQFQTVNTGFSSKVLYKSSHYPQANLDLALDIKRDETMLSNSLVLAHGPESEQKTNRLSFNHLSSRTGTPLKDYSLINKVEITYPAKSINFLFDQIIKAETSLFYGRLNVDNSGKKILNNELTFDLSPKDSNLIYELNGKFAFVDELEVTIQDKGKKSGANTFTFSPVVQFKKYNRKFEMPGKATIVNKNGEKVSFSVDAEAKDSTFPDSVKIHHSFDYVKDVSFTMKNKFEMGGQTHLLLDGVFTKGDIPQFPNAQVVLTIKDRVDGKFTSKISSKDSSVDIDVKLLRFDRRITIKATRKVEGIKRMGFLQVAWDADRDPSKQFTSEGTVLFDSAKGTVDLKSKLTMETTPYTIDFEGSFGTGMLKGEKTIKFEMAAPSSKSKVTVDSSVLYEDKKTAVKFQVATVGASGKTVVVNVRNEVSSLNRETLSFESTHESAVSVNGVEEFKINFDINRVVKADKRNTDLKVILSIPKVTPTVEGTAKVEVGKNSLRSAITYKRGSLEVAIDTSGKLVKTDSKTVLEGIFDLKVPMTPWKQIKITDSLGWSYTAYNNFESDFKVAIVFGPNSETIKLDRSLAVTPTTFSYKYKSETPYSIARRQSADISGTYDPSRPRLEGSAVINWSDPSKKEPQEVSISFDTEYNNRNIKFVLNTASPLVAAKNGEVLFEVVFLNDNQAVETTFNAGLNDKHVKFNGRVGMLPNQKEVDLNLVLPSFNPIRLVGRVDTKSPSYNVESRLDWGAGSIKVDGSGKFISIEDFKVKLTFDSPELGINSYELQASNQSKGKLRQIEFELAKKSVSIALFKASYTTKDTSSLTEIRGTAEVKVNEPQAAGSVSFLVQKKTVSKGAEKGDEYSLEIDTTTGDLVLSKVNGNFKRTNRETSGAYSICNSNKDCREGNFVFVKDIGTYDIEASVIVKAKNAATEEIQGFNFKRTNKPKKYELSLEVIFDQVGNRKINFLVYRNEKEAGFDFSTPKRLTSLAIKTTGTNQKKTYAVSFWMDKTKNPERKLDITIEVKPSKLNEMEGASSIITILHPFLTRPYVHHLDYHIQTTPSQFHFKYDFDVLDQIHKRWTIETTIRDDILGHNGHNITVDTSLKSEGTGLSVDTRFYGRVYEAAYSAGGVVQFKDKGTVQKELFLNSAASPKRLAFSLGSPAKHISYEANWNSEHVLNHRRIQFTSSAAFLGVEPVVFALDANASPSIDLKAFLRAHPENYYRVSGGVDHEDLDNVELSFEHKKGGQTKKLAALYAQVNSSNILTTGATWKLEDLKQIRSILQARRSQAAQEIKSAHASLSKDLTAIALKWEVNNNFKADLAKLKERLLRVAVDFNKDSQSDESLREIIALTKFNEKLIQRASAAFDECIKTWPSYQDKIKEFSKRAEASQQKFDAFINELQENIDHYFANLKKRWENGEGYLGPIKKYISFIYEKLKENQKLYQAMVEKNQSGYQSYYQTLYTTAQQFVQKMIKEIDIDAVVQKYASDLEKSIITPIEKIRYDFVSKYPEVSRLVYRNFDYPLNLLRGFLKKISTEPSRRIAEFQSYFVDRNTEKPMFGKLVTYDVEKGEIQYELPLNQAVFQLMLQTKKADEDRPSPISLYQKRPSYRSVHDRVIQGLNFIDTRSTSVRARGFAALVGGSTFLTFDRKTFDLENANCQYLLARDFVNKDFAVSVIYRDASGQADKRSILFSDLDDQVEITSSNVLVNNQESTLPATLKNIRVSRQGDVVVVERTDGAVLKCDTVNDYCSFDVSPIYHGRTMGLWGTFSNDGADDFTDSNGKVVNELNAFTASWKINKYCSDKAETQLTNNTSYFRDCEKFFESKSSILSPCFGVVSPTPFHDMCTSQANSRGVHSVVLAYSSTCERFGFRPFVSSF